VSLTVFLFAGYAGSPPANAPVIAKIDSVATVAVLVALLLLFTKLKEPLSPVSLTTQTRNALERFPTVSEFAKPAILR
jgi:hypothetical protein